jgi:ADP-heptose:LPS heptosyltransferase
VIFFQGDERISIDFLGGLFSWTQLVVAPSTGPLHLGVALGKPVVSFYPPIRVQSALRWGPYLADESRASILVPEVYCGQEFECRGNLCHYFPCMRSITVTQAIEEVQRQLSNVQGKANAPSSQTP